MRKTLQVLGEKSAQPQKWWPDHPQRSGRKKEPKPKLFGPDIFQWGRGLPRERVGAKKFDTSLETREIKLFGRDIPGFCRDIPEVPEKFEKKKVCVQFPFWVRKALQYQWKPSPIPNRHLSPLSPLAWEAPKSGTEKQPKHQAFGRDILRTVTRSSLEVH